MKKFLFKVLLPFLAIIICVLGGLELYLRSLPNDYKTQREYVEAHADSLKLLVLGSSSTSRGIIPRYLDVQPAYNCAYSGRSIDFDYYILNNYIAKMDSLKYVIIDMNYSRLWWRIEASSTASSYLKYFSIYWGITKSKGFDYQYEISTSFTDIKGLRSKFQKSKLEYDGYQSGKSLPYDEQKWRSLAKDRINYFVIEQDKEKEYFDNNLECLKRIIKICQSRGVYVLMVWVPVDKTFSDLFDENRLQVIDETMDDLQKEYSNFRYYDLVKDTSFNHNDMLNVDHLNRQGATKLTKRINDYIKDIEKN